MKPVAIFRHAKTEGPGYFAEFLTKNNIKWQLIKLDRHEAVPPDASAYAGLCFMGGPMSVNDNLPWIGAVLNLIRGAVAQERPVIGHCLGGQLLSKALGGVITQNAVKEIGWGEVSVINDAAAQEWLGELRSFNSFHWHGETFSIPPGAQHIAATPYCANQIFVIGNHIGMQCHVEMTDELVQTWCASGAREIDESKTSPAVMDIAAITQDLGPRLQALHGVAARIYTRWIRALKN